MKNILFSFTILLLILFFTSSCEDTFTTTVDVDLPETENRIVLNCIYNDTTNFRVFVYRSQDVLQDVEDFETIDDAIVQLYGDGALMETLNKFISIDTVYDNFGNQVAKETTYYASNTIAQQGMVYTLKASAEGFEDVEAVSTIPTNIEINNSSVEIIQEFPDGWEPGYSTYRLSIDFDDPANKEDYYFIDLSFTRTIDKEGIAIYLEEIIAQSPNGELPDSLIWMPDFLEYVNAYESNNVCFVSSDPSLQEASQFDEVEIGGEAVAYFCDFTIFSDNLFDGENKKISLETEESFGSYFGVDFLNDFVSTAIQLKYGTVSRDFALYQKSALFQSYNEGNFFAEPIQVYTNVENGFGIFAGYSFNTLDIAVE